MREQVERRCDGHTEQFACCDVVVDFSAKFQEYGLIVHDGGASVILIAFCPWCDKRLPESQRERWFEELENRGIDAWADRIPDHYQDDRWLRR